MSMEYSSDTIITESKRNYNKRYSKTLCLFVLVIISVFSLFSSCRSRGAIRAEEYFSIGMAYFDMGKFAEAEMWLNRAKAADRTMTASAYNLGRIAFETGRYGEAVRFFESILDKDKNNVMALKAAAYSRIKNGDLEKAEALYERVLNLIPENADDGFNYALVLYGLKKYDSCEEVLSRYPFSLEENSASMLLLARAQKAQNKIETIDSYAKWLSIATPGPQGLFEYAQVLETADLYALALEQYNAALTALTVDTEELKRSQLLFHQARLLMIADPESTEGITELRAALSAGFSDTAAIEDLLLDERISQTNRDTIKGLLNSNLITAEEPVEEAQENMEYTEFEF